MGLFPAKELWASDRYVRATRLASDAGIVPVRLVDGSDLTASLRNAHCASKGRATHSDTTALLLHDIPRRCSSRWRCLRAGRREGDGREETAPEKHQAPRFPSPAAAADQPAGAAPLWFVHAAPFVSAYRSASARQVVGSSAGAHVKTTARAGSSSAESSVSRPIALRRAWGGAQSCPPSSESSVPPSRRPCHPGKATARARSRNAWS